MDRSILPLIIIETFILFIYLLLQVTRYASKQVSYYVKILCVFSYMLSGSLLIVLPLEIYQQELDSKTNNEEKEDLNTQIGDIWIGFYWVNFALTWFLLPITKEYEEAGDFTIQDKLKRSIKINLIIYAIGAALGLIFIIVLLIKKELEWTSLTETLIALSNGFGLVLIVIFLGYGLVAVPKYFYRQNDFMIKLKREYSDYYKNTYNISDSEFELEDYIQSIQSLQNKYRQNYEFRPYFDRILEQVPMKYIDEAQKRQSLYNDTKNLDSNNDLDINKLADINKNVANLIQKIHRLQAAQKIISEKALFLEDQESSMNSKSRKIVSGIRPSRTGCSGPCINFIEWFWYCRIRKYVCIVFTIIFGILSTLIIFAQLGLFIKWLSSIDIFQYWFYKSERFIVVQMLSLIPLGYILFCISFGLLQIEVGGFYGFYNFKQTDQSSLLFAATFASRITFPLSFNFLKMVNLQNSSPLTNVTGSFNLSSYFESIILPVLLIVITLFNIFDVYGKILRALGLNRFQFDHDYNDANITDGKNYIWKRKRIDIDLNLLMFFFQVRQEKQLSYVNINDSNSTQPLWPNSSQSKI